MTAIDGWEQQEGGLWLKVSQFDPRDPNITASDLKILDESVQSVARKHGATVNPRSFYHNYHAIRSGGLIVDLYQAKWDICNPKSICLGATYGWENYYFTPDGQLVRTRYTEDVALPMSQRRALVKSKPDGVPFPKKSIAALLEQIHLKQMADDGVVYRFGEVDADNTAMMRQLGENDAEMGTGGNSAVLQLEHIPIDSIASELTPVKVIPIIRRGISDENNFYVRWHDGHCDYRLIVSRGHATTKGRASARADIRTWHNGQLPEQHILESVLASAMRAIKHEVEVERKWGKPHELEYPMSWMAKTGQFLAGG